MITHSSTSALVAQAGSVLRTEAYHRNGFGLMLISGRLSPGSEFRGTGRGEDGACALCAKELRVPGAGVYSWYCWGYEESKGVEYGGVGRV